MPAKLVGESQRSIHHAVVGKHNSVVERATADQTHGAKRLDIALKTEGAGTSQQLPKGIRQNDDFDLLLAPQRMRKIAGALHPKFIGRVNANAAILFDDFHGLDDFEGAGAPTQPANPSLI